MHLYAPFDGTVVEKQGEEGEIITPTAMSSSLGRTAVVTIANLETDGRRDRHLREPALADRAGPAGRGLRQRDPVASAIAGRLRQVLPMGDRTRGTVKVKVEILDPDDKLFPELAATVHFLPSKTGQQPGRRPVVPLRAQVGRVPGERPRLRLGHRRGTTSLRKRPVEVATTTDDLARVESGLKYGESVVLNPIKALHDNEVVRIAE